MSACCILGIPQCCSHRNLPSDPGTPWPDPLTGTFVSGEDTLIFNGDGSSLYWNFAEELEVVGKQGNGFYLFMFDNKSWRYDAAESFRISTKDLNNMSFNLSLSERATDSVFTIFRHDLDGCPSKTFKKIK